MNPSLASLPPLGEEIKNFFRATQRPLAIAGTDIETSRRPDIQDLLPENTPERPTRREDAFNMAALMPLYGEIKLVGVTDSLGNYCACAEKTEKETLQKYWRCLGPTPQNLLHTGWNIRDFDFPFLVAASLLNGVEVPECFVSTSKWGDRGIVICDGMQILAQGQGARGHSPLEQVCRRLGIPGKTGDHGKNFGEAWAIPENRPKLIEYNRVDNDRPIRIGIRTGIISAVVRAHCADSWKKSFQPISDVPFILGAEFISIPAEERPRLSRDPAQRQTVEIPCQPELLAVAQTRRVVSHYEL